MTRYAPDDIPTLPADAIRDALGRADLDAAAALLEAHDRAVRLALADDVLLDPRQAQRWANLQQEQQALLEELTRLRDQTGEQLRQLQRHQRGALAYLRSGG